MKFIPFASVAIVALRNQEANASRLHVTKCSALDKYCDTNEYDTEFAAESKKGGYDATPVDNFSKKEDAALPTALDGEALI